MEQYIYIYIYISLFSYFRLSVFKISVYVIIDESSEVLI